MIQEFKDFINKGGVFEAAVGLILALAFIPVVNSLVADIIMPIVGAIFGQPDFADLKINLGGTECTTDAAGVETCVQAAIRYGAWINTIVTFVLVSLVMFMMVKVYNRATKPVAEEDGPSEVDLLTEIRDSLAK